jgi:release factor glutamine methyltransferase
MPTHLDDSSISSLLLQAAARLAQGPHPDRARLDADSLLLHVLDQGKAWLMAHGDDPFSPLDSERFQAFIDRRLTGEPIQYILGEAEFYGLPFRVTPAVLIPRPETEHLVEKALELAVGFPSPRILDIGTGSGAIAVAVANRLAKNGFVTGHDFNCADRANNRTGALAPEGTPFSVTAIDLSPEALAIAEENAKRNGVSIRFLHADLFTPIAPLSMGAPGPDFRTGEASNPNSPVLDEQFDLILSNPPYIPTIDGPSLSVEVRDHEPALALFAGEDGLAIYRRLIPATYEHLVSGGHLLLEIGYGQQAEIENLLVASGFTSIEFLPDLQNIPRVACAQKKP